MVVKGVVNKLLLGQKGGEMNNILLVVGNEKGCEIFFTLDHDLYKVFAPVHSTKVIEMILGYYYRSLEGNIKQIQNSFNFNQKVPVFIDVNRMLFFPTITKNNRECCWINYYCISSVRKSKRNTIIKFYDHSFLNPHSEVLFEYEFPFEVRSIRNQMKRCEMIHKNFILQTRNLEVLASMTDRR